MPVPTEVTQLFPERKQVPLEGLYLDQRLRDIAQQIGRPLVLTAYVTDRNGVVADKNEKGNLQVPPQLRSLGDWHLFQELMAQSDVVLSGSAYLERFKASGKAAEDILFQYQPGGEFEKLGQWRLDSGLGKRQPDLVFLTHHLDFEMPPEILRGDRKVFIFTTYAMAESPSAGAFADQGAVVVGSGETGVEGGRLIDYLGMDPAYRVIMMATGPTVLDLLLEADRLDLLYITEVQREIPFKVPDDIRMILPDGKRVDEMDRFTLTQRFLEENAIQQDGAHNPQEFRRYDRKDLFLD